jgi:CheY-like chemotaxis protein
MEDAEANYEGKLNLPPGSYVRLNVTDTGVGMSEEIQKRVFEPFFTTKAEKGTGLGLATVYGIVHQWKGGISLYSKPGLGTTFSVYFPAIPEVKAAPTKPQQIPLILHGSETILVAEDEEAVRKVIVRNLEKSGYRVLEARNGAEAVQKALNYREPIHLLLTDTIMPKMNGRDLADELKRTLTQLKVLFISGYPQEVLSQQGILDPGIHLLQKPFSAEELMKQVRKVLDEK